VLRHLRNEGLDLVSLDEMHRRLFERDFSRRFVCLTIDDGYRDTLEWAYPILKRHKAPFAVYVATSFPDRLGELWWLALEAVVARSKHISLPINGRKRDFECATVAEKRNTFAELYDYVRSLASEEALRQLVRDLTLRYQVDVLSFCNELCMGWDELGTLASDPLVTIGAHTVNHVMLAKVPQKAARTEMDMSRAVIEAALGRRPDHLSFPVGDRTSAGPREFQIATDLGFKTAVTRGGGAVSAAPRPPHRAAAHLAQRRVPADALCAGAPVRCGDGCLKQIPPNRRRLTAHGRDIQRTSGIAGRTQPSPAAA